MSDLDLRHLLAMLDDPDENIAVSVMGELLRHSDELPDLLCEMQEADDPLLRKRVQQLESILLMQQRRKEFLKLLEQDSCDIVQGLIELHLLWFDRDNPELLLDMLRTFMEVAANNQIRNISELGSFMARNNFALPPQEEALEPENFCIGPILEDRLGSDIMLCTLALLAGIDAGLELGLVRVAGHFAVMNTAGEMISPNNDWLVDRINRLERGDFWNEPRQVLKYASLMLFFNAVASDNFRSVHTIGHALSGGDGRELLDFLPYPYNGAVNEASSEKK